jgi:SAM-dependent methyltransferase
MVRTATLARSVSLFRAFLKEQSDPDLFYGALARDSVEQLGEHVALKGSAVLDVGGGPGYFADAFRGAGATYVGLEPDAGEMVARGTPEPGTVRGSGEALPVRTDAVDVCYSSNVLEHVRRPWTMTAEMLRVTRPGGTVFLSFTPWWSPWGGHETAPWHYLGGHRARRRYRRRTGHEPKNRFGESLFPVSVGAALRWARTRPDAEVVAVFPRYHPWWARWVVAVPLLREVVSWNLVVVLRKIQGTSTRPECGR